MTAWANTAAAPPDADDVLLARQPIVDRDRRTVGYELLYRGARRPDGRPLDEAYATSEVVFNAWLQTGRRALAHGLPLWLNFTRASLLRFETLPVGAGEAVIEVVESTRVDDQVVDAVRQLKRAGHLIALDDFEFDGATAPLVELADVVKLDISTRGLDEVIADGEALRRHGVRLLAEKVETHAQYERLRDAGFDLFQGWFIERPHPVTGSRSPSLIGNNVLLLSRLADAGHDLQAIEALVQDDPVAVFRLLRLANSAFYAGRQPVSTIRDGLMRVGTADATQWLSLMALHGISDPENPVLRIGAERAHLCAALASGEPDAVRRRAFLVGLLSVLDAIVGPLEGVLEELALSPAVVGALLFGEGEDGRRLAQARALQRGAALDDGVAVAQPGRLLADATAAADAQLAGLAAIP